jgi:hypothetical protein
MTTPARGQHHRNAATEIAGLARTLDLKLPDSPLVKAAYEHAEEISDPWLFKHVVRSWLFAAALAQAQQLKHDAELLAASTLLHDIGLTAAFTGEVRFEVFGANAARDFVARHGVDTPGQRIIWDAIALHSTPSIAHFKEVEVACCQYGIGMDFGGLGIDQLDRSTVDAIVAAVPRLSLKDEMKRCMCRLAREHPHSTYGTFVEEFGRRFVDDYSTPISPVDLLLHAPFDE